MDYTFPYICTGWKMSFYCLNSLKFFTIKGVFVRKKQCRSPVCCKGQGPIYEGKVNSCPRYTPVLMSPSCASCATVILCTENLSFYSLIMQR